MKQTFKIKQTDLYIKIKLWQKFILIYSAGQHNKDFLKFNHFFLKLFYNNIKKNINLIITTYLKNSH